MLPLNDNMQQSVARQTMTHKNTWEDQTIAQARWQEWKASNKTSHHKTMIDTKHDHIFSLRTPIWDEGIINL